MGGDYPNKRNNANSGGIGFSEPNNKDYELAAPTGPEHYSSAFLGLQDLQKEMYEDIKKSFVGEEERRFQKKWNKKMKEDAIREAKLDLQEANRRELMEERMKVEVEVGEELRKVRGELEVVKKKLRGKEQELKGLRERCVCGGGGEDIVMQSIEQTPDGEGGFVEEESEEGFVFRKLSKREERELSKEEFNAYRYELMARVRASVWSKKGADKAASTDVGAP